MDSALFTSDTLSNDSLFGGRPPAAFRKMTLLSGQDTVRGAVLGRKMTAGTIVGAAHAGNTGTGAISALSISGASRVGRYRVVFIEPGTNAGIYTVIAPDGRNVGTGTVPGAFAGEINFSIADATDFISGDSFDIDVSAPTYKYELAAATATDGSQNPEAILAQDCDATSADADCLIYEDGVFNATQLTFGSGHTADTVRDALRVKGIILVGAQTTVDP